MKPGAKNSDPSSSDPQIYYLHVRLGVPRQNHRPFVTLMERLLSVIHDLYGWEFVHGSYPISGEVNQFVHVWKIPDPADVLHIMRHGAFNQKAALLPTRSNLNVDSEAYRYFRAIYWELQGLITETSHALTTALPADPNYEGFQSQTILIERKDGKPDWFLIDHEKMKKEWKKRDLRACVDALQFFERRERWAKEGPPEAQPRPDNEFGNFAEWEADEGYRKLKGRLQLREKEAAKVGVPAKSDSAFGPFQPGDIDWDSIASIRQLLNFGATHASVKSPLLAESQAEKMYTLVNLSALKPRSVQQEGYMPPESELNEPKAGPLKAGESTDNLLIVAPWGSIYCVDKGDVAKVARSVQFQGKTQEKGKTTDQRLETFTDGHIPLGSILEPRDGQIGDGCACYVINLNAIPAPHEGKSKTKSAKRS